MPPVIPTSPVTTPISSRKRCGAIWKTAPLLAPSAIMLNITIGERQPCGRPGEARGRDQSGDGDEVDDGQRANAAEAVGQPAADGSREGPAKTQAAVKYPRRPPKFILGVEEDGERGGQSDKAAEGYRVEKHQHPRIACLQHVK